MRNIFLQSLTVNLINFKFIDTVKRTDSIQSRHGQRKVSSLSDRSDNSEQGAASGGEEESPGILSDDQPPESPSDHEADEISKNFPWLRAVLGIINSFNYYCTHQNFCHPYCFKRHMRAATRLMKSVRKVRILLIFGIPCVV